MDHYVSITITQVNMVHEIFTALSNYRYKTERFPLLTSV
jgi:hypothetical protein